MPFNSSANFSLPPTLLITCLAVGMRCKGILQLRRKNTATEMHEVKGQYGLEAG